MPESLPPGVVTVTRRTTVAALPLVALAGCQWGPEDEDSPAEEQAQDADAGLVKAALEAIDQVSAFVTFVATQHIGLAAALAPLEAVHTAHRQLLSPDTTSSAGPAPAPTYESSAAALTRIRRDEARLQTQLADLATSAVSGTLARALASMSASIAQHLAVLPEVTNRGPA